jgi:uncharacterized protein YjlB
MEISTHQIAGRGDIPNNPLLPLIVYKSVVDGEGDAAAAAFEQMFEANGWTGCWRNGIFDFHHFHSTAHEVLGIYAGAASVQFGGPDGIVIEAETGDVIVVPAGVGHKKLNARGKFGVVGAYPIAQSPDICEPGVGDTAHYGANVATVSIPARDPVSGESGPIVDIWRR